MPTPILRKPKGVSLLFGLSAFLSSEINAEPSRATLPESFDDYEHYTTVRRGESTEHIMTEPNTIEALQQGLEAPDGSRFLLVDYRNEAIYRIFVMEKGPGWGRDYANNEAAGDWHFQWYWPDGSINEERDTSWCRNCHNNREDEQFLFTYDELMNHRQGHLD